MWFQNSSWQDCATQGSLSKEDAAFICVEALDAVPEKGFVFEVWQSSSILHRKLFRGSTFVGSNLSLYE